MQLETQFGNPQFLRPEGMPRSLAESVRTTDLQAEIQQVVEREVQRRAATARPEEVMQGVNPTASSGIRMLQGGQEA